MEQIRSFIAIELPPVIKAELTSLEEKLKRGRYPFVKWVAPESIHLTLKFLGNIAASTVPQIIETITGVVKKIPALQLQVGGLGAFPNMKRPQVVWVGIGGEIERLATLQKDVDAALSPLGFPRESRSFSPHLTLGRLRERVLPAERQNFAQWICSVEFETSLSFEVNALRLMKSQLTPSGAIYSQLGSIELLCRP